jgi:glucose/arabinose dehydrogenase
VGPAARSAVATAIAAAVVALGATGSSAASPPPPQPGGLELREIASFEQPTYVTQAPGEPKTLYVVEQQGKVIAVRKGHKLGEPFLDITDLVHFGPAETPSVEAGMYSMAFDPNYQRNHRFYVFYTGPGGANYIDGYEREDGNAVRADPATRREALKIVHPYADSHNGGQLQFGPDGMLWISSGDGGCCGDAYDQARSLGTLLGKLLRIDPDPPRRDGGARPAPGNPLVGVKGAPKQIYSWGLRNTWRFSFDRLTGALALADVGDNSNAREEVDYLSRHAAKGANFGWPEYQGFHLSDPTRPGPGEPLMPVFNYPHHDGRCAITGGYVVRDPGLPQLYGRYLYADYCGGRIRSFTVPELDAAGLPTGGRVTDDRDEGLYLPYPSSFGEGLNGQIYVASLNGPVFRIEAAR